MAINKVASAALALSLAACTAPGASAGDESDDPAGPLNELSGGVAATPTDFPSVLNIGGCTAVKVAPNKLLTAARCVWTFGSKTFAPRFASQQLWVTSSPTPPSQTSRSKTDPRTDWVRIRITGAYLDPAWVNGLGEAYTSSSDLAVVVIADADVAAIDPVPVATFDSAGLPVGSQVALTGYGCGAKSADGTTLAPLTYRKTRTIEDRGLAPIGSRYFFTAQAGKDPSSASVCTGDTGAPVFGLDAAGNPNRVVGVTSFGMGDKGSAIHARLNLVWIGDAVAGSAKATTFIAIDARGTTCLGGAGTVIGAIDQKYKELGGCTSFLGVPEGDEQKTPDGVGRFNAFTGGSIYWTSGTGAHEVHGSIRDAWRLSGWEGGPLGYPTSDQLATADARGSYNTFQNGAVYASPTTGAHEVHGRIYEKWRELGLEQSSLGYPISDSLTVPEGSQSAFEHGTITWIAARSEAVVSTTSP